MVRRSAAVLAIVLGAALAYSTGALRPLDNRLAEFRFGQLTRAPTGSVVLVDIDAKSLAAIGVWPWPRTVHAQIVDALTGYGAAEIAFDIDFSAQSSPAADAAFAAALKRANGAVILAGFNQALDARGGSGAVHTNVPIAALSEHAWVAAVNVSPDADGLVRGVSLGEPVAGQQMPAMAAMLGGHAGELDGEFSVDFGIDATRIDRISTIDLLNGAVEPARIAGKKVIVGAAAVELSDFFHVPVFGVVSGPLLQALATESILQGRMLQPLHAGAVVLGLLILALIGVLSGKRSLTVALGALALASLLAEGMALTVQAYLPVVAHTGVLHVTAAGLALLALVRELGSRAILLAIARTETGNARKILAQVVSDNFAAVIVAGEDGIIEAASRSAGEMLRPGRGELAGLPCKDALPEVLASALASAVAQAQLQTWEEKGLQELVFTRPGGEPRILDYVVRPSRLSGGFSKLGRRLPDRVFATVTFVDVTEKRKEEARLAYLARFDTLTGLPNRNQFCEVLEAQCSAARHPPFGGAVLFFNLDRFHTVNDALGHHYGDLLLKAVAERVQLLVGPDDVPARFGGDQYGILYSGVDGREGAAALAGRLIETVSEPYQIDAHRMIIGISVGIAAAAENGADPARLMKNADTALYRAKARGGNAFRVYDQEMDRRLHARQALEIDLWDAFERNQFEVHYQPQVDLASDQIIGAEALVRWHHPARGWVPPIDFIAVAESIGLIEPLGNFVLSEACRAAANWPKPIKVAVNVSPVQFTRGDLLATVRQALRTSGLPAERLDLEITESLFINDNPHVHATMEALRALGVSFSLDDFGTGYSSLAYIRKFPVQKIKIDRCFVTGLPFEKESVAIVRAITALAESLAIRVNAEGVETAEHVAALRLLGCAEAQGYLFGRPEPGEELARLLERDGAPTRRTA